jgi:hypothetical protein
MQQRIDRINEVLREQLSGIRVVRALFENQKKLNDSEPETLK